MIQAGLTYRRSKRDVLGWEAIDLQSHILEHDGHGLHDLRPLGVSRPWPDVHVDLEAVREACFRQHRPGPVRVEFRHRDWHERLVLEERQPDGRLPQAEQERVHNGLAIDRVPVQRPSHVDVR